MDGRCVEAEGGFYERRRSCLKGLILLFDSTIIIMISVVCVCVCVYKRVMKGGIFLQGKWRKLY